MNKGIVLKHPVQEGYITGRNGTFDLRALSAWGVGGRYIHLDGIGMRGHEINGGFSLLAEDLAAFCEEYLKAYKHKTTDPLVEQYLKGEVSCPYCGDGDIDGEEVEVEGNGASQHITCSTCGSSWWDIHKLDSIIEEAHEDHSGDGQRESTGDDQGRV